MKIINPLPALGLGEIITPNRTIRWITTTLSYATFFKKDVPRFPNLTISDLAPEVKACGLYWCAQVYNNPRVINGSATAAAATPDWTYPLDIQHTTGDTSEQNSEGRFDVLHPVSGNTSFLGNFTIMQSPHLTLTDLFTNLFTLSFADGNEVFPTAWHEPDTGPLAHAGMSGFTSAVWRNKSIEATFARLAASLTEQIRMEFGFANASVGLALDRETYVLVRWEWLALPMGVFVLAVGLLVATVVVNGRTRTVIWKSSSVALLMHRLEGWSGGDLVRPRNVGEMNAFAAGAWATLMGGQEGYRFVRESKLERG